MDGDSVHLNRLLGQPKFFFYRKCFVPAAERFLVDFDAPQNAEVVSGRKYLKTAAKNKGKKSQRKPLGSDRRKKPQLMNFQQTAKQTNRSRRDIFTHISHKSCQTTFGTSFVRRFLEI